MHKIGGYSKMIMPHEHEELSKRSKIIYYTIMIVVTIFIMGTVGFIILTNLDTYDREVVSFDPTDTQLLFMMAPLIIMIIAASIMLIVFYLKKESPVTTELYPHGEDKNE
jgi:biotin transporter BioY